MRNIRIIACSFPLLFAVQSCVDPGKIDQTNQTLKQNLQELRQLNQNFVKASEKMDEIGRPMAEMASEITRMTNTIVDAGPEILKGVEAASNVIALIEEFRPEDFKRFGRQVAEFTEAFAELNYDLAEQGTDLPTLFSESAHVLSALGSVLPNLENVSSEDRMSVEGGILDLAAAGLQLGVAGGEVAQEVSERLAQARDRVVENMELKGRPLTLLNIMVDRTEQMARIFPSMVTSLTDPELDVLLGLGPDFVHRAEEMDRVVKELVEAKTELEKDVREDATFLIEALNDVKVLKWHIFDIPSIDQFPSQQRRKVDKS